MSVCGDNRHDVMVTEFLKLPNIDVNLHDNNGATALMCACNFGCQPVVAALLSHPAIDVNSRDSLHRTALIYACCHGHLALVNELVMHPNIDVNVKCNEGFTALMCALLGPTCKPFVDAVGRIRTFFNRIGFPSPITSLDSALALIHYPFIDLNAQDDAGNTALHIACSKGYVDVVEILLSMPTIDVMILNGEGKSANECIVNGQSRENKSRIEQLFAECNACPWLK